MLTLVWQATGGEQAPLLGSRSVEAPLDALAVLHGIAQDIEVEEVKEDQVGNVSVHWTARQAPGGDGVKDQVQRSAGSVSHQVSGAFDSSPDAMEQAWHL